MKNIICNETLRERIKMNLAQFEVVAHQDAAYEDAAHEGAAYQKPGLKQAAVALTIVEVRHDPAIYDIPFREGWRDEAAIVLTQRAARLRKHAGQWALPGGRMDPGESPEETALRELEEEVGVKVDRNRVLGRLDDFITRSGFIMKPVVVWGGTELELIPNPAEVAAVHRIPLREFMRPDSPTFHKIPNSDQPVLIMPVGHSWIAAPTAAIIYQFREVAILGSEIRVAHYEQPFFAWQ